MKKARIRSSKDRELRQYIRINNITETLEAILTALAVTTPKDSLLYIQTCLEDIQGLSYGEIHWDMFIPQELRPKKKVISPRAFEFILDGDEGDYVAEPSPEQFHKACMFYNYKILKLTIRAWIKFVVVKKEIETKLAIKMEIAAKQEARNLLKSSLRLWKAFIDHKMTKAKRAAVKLKSVYGHYVTQVIFDSWYDSALDAKKTREYFERLEQTEKKEANAVVDIQPIEGEDNISKLPVTLSSHILGFLSIADLCRCSMVCRSWKMIIQSSTLWNRVDLNQIKDKLNDSIIISLLNIARPFLVHLNLRGCEKFGHLGFSAIAQCRNLQDINLSGCPVTDEMIEDIAYSCSSQLLYVNLSFTMITDASLRCLANLTPNIQYLSLSNCSAFTSKGLNYLCKGRMANRLRHLDLTGCDQISPGGFNQIGKCCENLRNIYLNDLPNLTNQAFTSIINGCTKLRSVSLLHSPLLTDESLTCLGDLKNLTFFRIEGNHRVSDNCLKALANCENLRHLYMVDCPRITDIGLRALTALSKLVVFNVADCFRISDAGVRAIVEGASCSTLREINLSNCVRVTDVSMLRIANNCKSLSYLVICFLEHLTDAGMECLGTITSLYSLDVSGCNVQDAGLQNLANHTELKQLILRDIPTVTDLGIQKYVTQVVDLEFLDVSFCMNLTDSAFKSIAYSCRRLSVLNAEGCFQISDLTIQYLSGACPHITQLNLSGCIDITDKSLKFIKRGCRKLRVFILNYLKNVSKSEVMKLKKAVEVVEWNSDYPPDNFKIPQERLR